MATGCIEAVNAASRSAPSWARVAWSQPLGLFAADPRYEENTLKGFIEGLAALLSRVCGAILYRRNVLSSLAVVVVEPWRVSETGTGNCVGERRLALVFTNGARIGITVRVYATLAGGFKGLEVSSDELECSGSWGQGVRQA